ncbi:MAG: hypothetical protein AAFX07_00525 [Pseudomonadota bacterium]
MTVEVYPGPPEYTVAGTGPYGIPHSYSSDTEFVVEAVDPETNVVTVLQPEDFSISPTGDADAGDLTLTAAAASDYEGDQLIIKRRTVIEQGWSGANSREVGIEKQFNRQTHALQEAQLDAREALSRAVATETVAQTAVAAAEASQGASELSAQSAQLSEAAQAAAEEAQSRAEDTLLNPRGPWLAGEVYQRRDLATFNGISYFCEADHTANDFPTDLALGRWSIFVQATPLGQLLTAINAVASIEANQLLYGSGTDEFATAVLTEFARSILAQDSRGAMRSLLELGGAAQLNVSSNPNLNSSVADLPTRGAVRDFVEQRASIFDDYPDVISAGSDERFLDETNRSTSSSAFETVLDWTFLQNGTVRVSYEHRAEANGGGNSEVQILIGGLVFNVQSRGDTSYVSRSFDVPVSRMTRLRIRHRYTLGGLVDGVSRIRNLRLSTDGPNLLPFSLDNRIIYDASAAATAPPVFTTQPSLDRATYSIGAVVQLDEGEVSEGVLEIVQFTLDGEDKRGELNGLEWNTAGEQPGTIEYQVLVTGSTGLETLSDVITAELFGDPARTLTSISAGAVVNGQLPITVVSPDAEDGDIVRWVLQPEGQTAPNDAQLVAGEPGTDATLLGASAYAWSAGEFASPVPDGIARQQVDLFVLIDNGVYSEIRSATFILDTADPAVTAETYDDGQALWALDIDEASLPARLSWAGMPDSASPEGDEIEAGAGGGILEAGFIPIGSDGVINTSFDLTELAIEKVQYVIRDAFDNVTDVRTVPGSVNVLADRFIGQWSTEGETTNPFVLNAAGAFVTDRTYLVFVNSTHDGSVTSVFLGAAEAFRANSFVGDDGETVVAGQGASSAWLVTAEADGALQISVTQTAGFGTEDVCVAVWDVTGLTLIDDDAELDFNESGNSIGRVWSSAGGPEVCMFTLAHFNGAVTDLQTENMELDARTDLAATVFLSASADSTPSGGESYEFINSTDDVFGAMHAIWMRKDS